MTEDTSPIAMLFERAEDYSKTTLKLIKLNAIDKSADVASSLVARLAVVMTVVFSVLIISMGVSIWLGKLLGDTSYGFFIVGAFYVFYTYVTIYMVAIYKDAFSVLTGIA